ncbi:hypothetical protein C8K30_11358 [Promicromonospora sp. AC04]|uniref:adenylyl cyclase n=1 Tax=Promicromonospora sp. AC04 TaxID=2135723 RepID=UPI000D3B093D|nr:adenylyl cyclase [Promicromonospora sp. AC04]PUB22190.1 hypothetical protein C8K30_11358 [Promicromonospora sp. AC04]
MRTLRTTLRGAAVAAVAASLAAGAAVTALPATATPTAANEGRTMAKASATKPTKPEAHKPKAHKPKKAAADPDFGPNVTFIDETWSVDRINQFLETVNDEAEFSLDRHQVYFEPGTYGSAAGQDDPATATGIVNAHVGYYESIAGLGAQPDDVHINGALHVEPVVGCPNEPWACADPGSLTRFWRSISNMGINPIQRPIGEDAALPYPAGVTEPHQMRFAVSQAAPMRRMDIQGNLTIFGRYGEFASGGYLANSRVSGTIVSGSQQQWFTRNSEVGGWDGGVWNMVFSGVTGAPATNFGQPVGEGVGVTTTIGSTPVSREAPFLYRDGTGELAVFVPNAKTGSSGTDWSTGPDAGQSIGISDFYVAKEGSDDAASINAALAGGKNLILTPGVYELDAPLRIDRADTVVLGLGYASLTPTAGNSVVEVGDVAGVKIAGITADANVPESQTLIKVGPEGATASDAADPTTLTDVFVRVGGPWAGKAVTSIEVNSPDTLLDHIWAWRGDHGNGIGWDVNTGAHGVVVNGDRVTATGLFVEHYQEEQTIWNGEDGQTLFYQNELPYDVPNQAAWNDGGRLGYAAYRVADDVQNHSAVGTGTYSFFNQGQDIRLESGIQAPSTPGVSFRSMTAIFLNGSGGINHVINNTGGAVQQGTQRSQVVTYP